MEHARVKSPLGVEEWAFVPALGGKTPDSLELNATENHHQTRNQQLADENRKLMIENKRLKEEVEQLTFTKQEEEKEIAARFTRLEEENHKMREDQVTMRLHLDKKVQRLYNARTTQLLESKRLRKICLDQAASLIDARQKVLKQDQRPSLGAAKEEEKVETMEQWLTSELKNEQRKRCSASETYETVPVNTLKKLKTAAFKAEVEKHCHWKASATQKNKQSCESKVMLGFPVSVYPAPAKYCISAKTLEMFELLDADGDQNAMQIQRDIDEMLVELNVNYDWCREYPVYALTDTTPQVDTVV